MKNLRLFYFGSLMWLLVGLFLISCSDKDKGNNAQVCPHGTIYMNGTCQPGNGSWGNQNYPPQGYYNPNGSIANSDQFKDFFVRVFGSNYMYGYGGTYNNTVQVKISNYNSPTSYIYISTPEVPTGGAALQAERFPYSDGSIIYQIYNYNPVRYIMGELVVHGDLSKQTNVKYEFNYKRNANQVAPTLIINGQNLRRGIDYY